MKRKFFKPLGVMLIAIFFSLAYLPTYSANAANTNITITNQTENNQTGDFTYRIQVTGFRTIFTDDVASFEYGSYGRICGVYLENANDINKTKIQQALGPEYDNAVIYVRFLQDESRVVTYFSAIYSYEPPFFYDDTWYFKANPSWMLGDTGMDASACAEFTEPISTASLQVYMSMDLSAYGTKPDISENNDNDPANEVYEFTLKNGESKTIPIPDGYNYLIWQLPQNDWELVDMNGDIASAKSFCRWYALYDCEGGLHGITGTTNIPEYVFTNRKLNNTTPTTPTTPTPDIAVPNTGKTSAEFSATKTGIVAFAIIATITRVSYLIRRYQKSKH